MADQTDAIAASLAAYLNNQNPDSLEIGTAAKGGGIKVYGNFSREAEFKNKIDSAKKILDYAREQLAQDAEKTK